MLADKAIKNNSLLQRKNICRLLLTVLFLCMVMNIYSVKDTKNKKDSSVKIPDWFLNPPKENNIIYATGFAQKKNQQLAIVSAADKARAEISNQLQIKITAMTRQLVEEAGVKDKTKTTEFAESVSVSLSSNVLNFSKIEKQEIYQRDSLFLAYVLVKLNLDEMNELVNSTLMSFQTDYDKLDAKEDLEKLADDIKARIYKDFKKVTIAPNKTIVIKEIEMLDTPVEEKVNTGRKPAWVTNYPSLPDYYIGIGQGKSLEQAKDNAIGTLVSQIEVKVKSEIQDYMKETNGITQEEVSQNIRLSVKEDIEDLEVVEFYKAGEEEYWAYYRLSIEKYKKRQIEKMENAKINGLDFLTKSDDETDPALKFKYAFLGYYLVGKYVTRALKVDYKGRQIVLVNELTARMQKILSSYAIDILNPALEIDIINPQPVEVKFRIQQSGNPVINFPVLFTNDKGNLDISEKAITDSKGEAACILNKAIAMDKMQSFNLQLDLKTFVADAAESEEDILVFYNRLTKLGIPAKEAVVKVNPPLFSFDLKVLNDLSLNERYKNLAQAMASNFKNAFTKKTLASFTEKEAKLKLEMILDGTLSQSERSKQYYTRLVVTVNILENNNNKEIFTRSTPNQGIKGGSVTEEKSVRAAFDKYMSDFNDEMISAVLKFINGA